MSPVRRNALLLACGLVFQSGMIQLAVALGTVTIVAVTGVDSILGLGPAVFLVAGALAVGAVDRGRRVHGAGLAISFLVRPDPKAIGAAYATPAQAARPAAPLAEILRRPGVATAMVAAVASFAVMTGVMNLAGAVVVGHGHDHGDVFTVISAHIVGMYGLVLVAGDLIERIGRRRSMVIGLTVMAASNAGLAWFASIAGMSLSLFGLGLGWCLAYIAATTELVDRAAASERGRLIGLTDLISSFGGAALALSGGVVYTGAGGSVSLAIAASGLAVLAAAWVAGNGPVLLPSAAADA